jgi:hypothetical protein
MPAYEMSQSPTSRTAVIANTRTRGMAVALTALLAIAAASWVHPVRQMNGMDMGGTTPLGSSGSFVSMWALMMAAMMFPGRSRQSR